MKKNDNEKVFSPIAQRYSSITGQRIKQEREKKGLSHVALSDQIKEKYGVNVSKDALINYEANTEHDSRAYKNMGMRIEYLLCFADFFDVSCDYLLGKTDEPHKDMSAREAAEYTGLSGKTVKVLHNYVESEIQANFIKRFTEDLIVDQKIAETVPELMQKYAVAANKAVAEKQSLTLREKPDCHRVPEERDGHYSISANDAANMFRSEAIGEALGRIEAVIEQMLQEIARTWVMEPLDIVKVKEFRWDIFSERTDKDGLDVFQQSAFNDFYDD